MKVCIGPLDENPAVAQIIQTAVIPGEYSDIHAQLPRPGLPDVLVEGEAIRILWYERTS